MKTVHLIFFDAGGGHRSAANALREVIAEQKRPWRVEALNLQEQFDSLDVFRKLTGVRMQDIYNLTLKRGWTLGSPQVMRGMHGVIRLFHRQQVALMEKYWREHPTDLVVSLIPNFNRALHQGLQKAGSSAPLITVLTDLADFPPHFWIEKQRQYLVCGTDLAARQARSAGHAEERILRSSGMVLHPRFYLRPPMDRAKERERLGLAADRATGLVMFGGQGSPDMEDIAQKLGDRDANLQLILLCGHNRKLRERLQDMAADSRNPMHVEGFTLDVPYFMRLSDFFIGKPGPGSISEALRMGLPVIVERNAWTLPQERYNAEWLREKGAGIVLSSFREIAGAVDRMLAPEEYARYRANAGAQDNRAVFEIPDFMDRIMSGAAAPVDVIGRATGPGTSPWSRRQ